MALDLIIAFMLIMTGIAMIAIWIIDINDNPEVDMTNGFFHAREKHSNNIFWFHIVVEMITALLLIMGGIIIVIKAERLFPLVYLSLGALFYSSFNSLGWVLAYQNRRRYVYPIIAGLSIAVLSAVAFIA